jgi:hypothetical protein
MPGLSRLSSTVRVWDDTGAATPWSAVSDQPWLSVTSSGRDGGNLVLTANPNGLLSDRVYYATVSLSSSDANVTHADRIRVGLWVGSAAPQHILVSKAFAGVTTDPIRPYAYVHEAGKALMVYNIYTGAVVRTIDPVAPRLADMVASSDGSRLFAVDASNFKVVPIDLDAFTVGAPWALNASASARVSYARLHDTGLLFAGTGAVYIAATGTPLNLHFDAGYYGSALLSVSENGSRLCTLDSGISPYSLHCYGIAYRAPIRELSFQAGGGAVWGAGSNGQDVAVNADGTRAYVASGAPYHFDVYDPTQSPMPIVQSLPGDAYPNNVEVASDGRVLAGASVWYGDTDVWVYDARGYELDRFKLSGYAKALLPAQLKASGDALRIVALTDDPSLQFVSIGP